MIWIRDPLLFTTNQTWDSAWNLTEVERPVTATTSATTAYLYDASGNVTQETQDLASGVTLVTKSSYDAATNDLLDPVRIRQ